MKIRCGRQDRMSADNGIYILKANDGYRVVHAQAIENLWWWDEGTGSEKGELNPKYIYDYFYRCPLLKTKEAALSYADMLYNDIMDSGFYTEYGIQYIDGWEDKEFPTEGSEQ